MARPVVPQATPRRVTRSQSREVEGPFTKNGQVSKSAEQDAGLGKAGSSRLSMVHEQSPATSRQSSISRLGTSVVPESPSNPEGQSNISGTTFVPQDSSFEVGELDPIILVEELPDLHNATNRLLDLFVSKALDPRHILEEAKRIVNPRNTDSKRLKFAVRKFVGTMNGFSNQAFIDVALIKGLIPSVQPDGASQAWSPSPILHRANCAKLALDVLLATLGSQSPHQAIERLQSQFPAPFMDRIVKRSQPKPVGASTAEKQTFELALEIRTQYFIMELERHQTDKNFDPGAILKDVFYDELALEDDASAMDPGSLRGFQLPPTFQDENGRLPDQYQDDVIDRIGELELELSQDDELNVKNLKRAWWSRFLQRTARFVHSRNKEILSDLQQQPKIDDVEDLVRTEIEQRNEPTQETSREEVSVPDPEIRSSRALLPREDRSIPREPSVNETPSRTVNPPLPASHTQTSAQRLANRTSLPRSVPQETANRTVQSLVRDPNRRKSLEVLRKGFRHTLDALQRRQTRNREQDFSHLESQHPSRPSGMPETSTAGSQAPERTQPDEIPQSPLFVPDESSPPPDRTESLDLEGFDAEAESTRSPDMRRSHHTHNGLFFDSFDSPLARRTQPSPPKSTAEIRNDILGREPQRRTWTDRQPDARRVSPISESQSIERPRLTAMAPSSQRKRPLPGSDDDSDGFDQDHRTIDFAARRAQKPAKGPSANKRQRIDHSDESEAAAQLRENLTASSQRRLAQSTLAAQEAQSPQPIQSAQPAPVPSSSQPARALPFTSTQTTTQEPTRWLLHNTAGQEQSHTRPVIERRRGKNAWSQAETDRLILLMAIHGTGWAEIKRQDNLCPEANGGPLLTERTQVNLKDKARTIRAKCEREGLPLPKGFDGVGSRGD